PPRRRADDRRLRRQQPDPRPERRGLLHLAAAAGPRRLDRTPRPARSGRAVEPPRAGAERARRAPARARPAPGPGGLDGAVRAARPAGGARRPRALHELHGAAPSRPSLPGQRLRHEPGAPAVVLHVEDAIAGAAPAAAGHATRAGRGWVRPPPPRARGGAAWGV